MRQAHYLEVISHDTDSNFENWFLCHCVLVGVKGIQGVKGVLGPGRSPLICPPAKTNLACSAKFDGDEFFSGSDLGGGGVGSGGSRDSPP